MGSGSNHFVSDDEDEIDTMAGMRMLTEPCIQDNSECLDPSSITLKDRNKNKKKKSYR